MWYRKRIKRPELAPGHRLLLHLGAVDYQATVFVNGHIATQHEGGYTPFFADITDLLVEGEEQVIVVRAEDVAALGNWAQAWYGWVSGCFLAGYFDGADDKLIPKSIEELEILLDAYLLEKAVYELGYEFNNRPDWIVIPIKGILDLVGSTG